MRAHTDHEGASTSLVLEREVPQNQVKFRRFEHVHRKTYIAVCCIVLRELGCRAEHAFRRSRAPEWFGFRRTKLSPWFANDRTHGAAHWNRISANRATNSEDTRIQFAQWNSEYNRSGLQLARNSHARQYDPTVDH
jgi:hypothetical protein